MLRFVNQIKYRIDKIYNSRCFGRMIDIIDDFDLHHTKSADNKNKIARIIKGQFNALGMGESIDIKNFKV